MSFNDDLLRLIDELERLPGIGTRSAQRIAFFILKAPHEDVKRLVDAITRLKENTKYCSICQNLTSQDPCSICDDYRRDRGIICVVEKPMDVLAIERTGRYRGLYHVLHGLISPMDGIGPEDLKINELVERVRREKPSEIILALNPSIEGDATSLYISRLLKPLGVRITSLAKGIPFGGELEYADDITLSRALEGRREFEG